MTTRTPIAAANWKMNLLRRDAADFCRAIHSALGETAATAEVLIFPSFPLLTTVSQGLEGLPVAIGGQDLHAAASGAHTGDVSGPQLVDAGCSWVLCGHSERRQDHDESDQLVAAKVQAAARHGLVPLICLGETEQERDQGRTFEVLARQLAAAVGEGTERFEIAYEPVWAIGTGKTATPEIAQQAHVFLRGELESLIGSARAAGVRILYGGSANPGNVASLIVQPDIDGFLVGGASLDADTFLAIIRACGASA